MNETDFRETDMFNLDKFGQAALAMLGTLILTTTFVGAAIGPARAVETAPVVGHAEGHTDA